MNISDSIPRRAISIDLARSQAAQLTGEVLSKELKNVGLTCALASPKNCERYIRNVTNRLPLGKNQAFGIYMGDPSQIDHLARLNPDFEPTEAVPFPGAGIRIDSSWKPSQGALGYASDLMLVLAEANFNALRNHFEDFYCNDQGESESVKNDTTVEAIQSFFAETLTTAANTMIDGIDIADMKAVCTRLLQPKMKSDQNYDVSSFFIIFLVQDYNEQMHEASSIGAVILNWTLFVKNVSNKKEQTHETKIKLSGRSVIYDNVSVLDKHVDFLKTLITANQGDLAGIPNVDKLIIFPERPAACIETFRHGLPLLSKGQEARVLVLYSPNLNQVGMIDNTGTQATCSYSIALTTGFTQGESKSISSELSLEAGCEFMKAGFKISMNMTFYSESTQTREETVCYQVPADAKAYLYQGYVRYSTLCLNITTRALTYREDGLYLNNFVKTSTKPLTGA